MKINLLIRSFIIRTRQVSLLRWRGFLTSPHITEIIFYLHKVCATTSIVCYVSKQVYQSVPIISKFTINRFCAEIIESLEEISHVKNVHTSCSRL